MNQAQLIDQYLRLKRKLSDSYESWHSGRIDRLTDALRSVELELNARQLRSVPSSQTGRPAVRQLKVAV